MSRSLTPYEGPNFHPGDTVCWSSSAGGFTKSKQGTVVALVPAGTHAADALQFQDFKNIGSCRFLVAYDNESFDAYLGSARNFSGAISWYK